MTIYYHISMMVDMIEEEVDLIIEEVVHVRGGDVVVDMILEVVVDIEDN